LGLSENLAPGLGEMVDAMGLSFRSSVAIARAISPPDRNAGRYKLGDRRAGNLAITLTSLCSPPIFRRTMEKGEPGVAPMLT
jgi:hypothetical protein